MQQTPHIERQDGLSRKTFFYALIAGMLIFIPFLLYDKGYFIYYGDFNVQQIPFYQLAHESVRNGAVFWNWHTDLGANFIGSYSFYLLFSPFFWLTLPFPTAWIPAMMAPLLVLKTACAALTAQLYLRRFVHDGRYAVIGAMLYAFSGWMSFNIFFNHFHDVAVFFPLLLLGLERLITEDKKGVFALAVLCNAGVNYWFFVGEAVFVVLYYWVRTADKSWRPSWKKFLSVALEAVIGFLMAAVMVVPSVAALMGNPRTGTSNILLGWNIWLYWHEQRLPAILQSLFYPPELPARPNFFPDHGAKWASLSAWLPLFSMSGVLAYFFSRCNRDWLKKMLSLCLVFALVPVLNSTFILLNNSYYARWFYMPVLLMAMATARALEESGPVYGRDARRHFMRALRWCFFAVVLFAVMSGLTPHMDETDGLLFGLAKNSGMLWIYVAIAITCLALSAYLVLLLRRNRRFPAIVLVAVLAVSVGFHVFYLANGKNDRTRSQWMIDHAIHGREAIELPGADQFSRTDVYDSTDNLGMYWHLPTIQAFHSIVPSSIMEFYPEVGVTRDVASRPQASLFALRPLLSVRWLFIETNQEEQSPMPGYHYHSTQNGFHVYENAHYLPMGFSYDRTISPRMLEDIRKENRSNMMLRALVLEEDAAVRMSDMLTPLEEEQYSGFTAHDMVWDVERRRQYTASSFRVDAKGFTVVTKFDEPRVLFLSVPYDQGWNAQLVDVTQSSGNNGTPLQIEKANIGFMAIAVPAGHQEIRFAYSIPGLKIGACLSVGGGLLLMLYLYFTRAKPPKSPTDPAKIQGDLLAGKTVTLSEKEFTALYGDRNARRNALQTVLQQTKESSASETAAEEQPPSKEICPDEKKTM